MSNRNTEGTARGMKLEQPNQKPNEELSRASEGLHNTNDSVGESYNQVSESYFAGRACRLKRKVKLLFFAHGPKISNAYRLNPLANARLATGSQTGRTVASSIKYPPNLVPNRPRQFRCPRIVLVMNPSFKLTGRSSAGVYKYCQGRSR